LQTIRYCVEGRPSHLIFREHPFHAVSILENGCGRRLGLA
jgi:hypothetical protein